MEGLIDPVLFIVMFAQGFFLRKCTWPRIEIWAPAATSEHADLLLVGQVGPSGGSKKAVAIVWRQTHYETLVS